IIVDDVSYFYEGAYNDDEIAQAVNTVTANGVLYFSSAANSNNLTHGSSGTFEGDFSPSGTPLPAPILALEGQGTLHQFPSGPYTTVAATTDNPYPNADIISLKWSDHSYGSANDYDLFVMDPTGTLILGSSTNGQSGSSNQRPFELATCDLTEEDAQQIPPAGTIHSPCNINNTTQTCTASNNF